MMLAPTVVSAEELLIKKKKQKKNIQPFLIIIGDELASPNEILVYFDEIKYKLPSTLHAILVCFQIFQVFNLKYPDESHDVWYFIQKYFFNIVTNFDTNCIKVLQLITDINIQN